MAGLEVEAFFDALLVDFIFKPKIDPRDYTIVTLGLRYLRAESHKPRQRRDHKAIKETWNTIWPLLDTFKLLGPYRNDAQIKSRLLFFIDNGFGIDASKSGKRLWAQFTYELRCLKAVAIIYLPNFRILNHR